MVEETVGYANTAGKEYLFYSKLVIEILKLNFKAVAVLLKDGSSALQLGQPEIYNFFLIFKERVK